MPDQEFFRRLGIFVLAGFVAEGKCQELIQRISQAPKRPGPVSSAEGGKTVDQDRRSVGDAEIPKAVKAALVRPILDLGPALERHFGMPLEWGGEGPSYLLYRPGDFHKPHSDRADPALNTRLSRRRVIVVLFLNGYSREFRENYFGGGLLNFYGLLEGPQWERCVFGIEPEPGLLVAFPAGLVHEVTPITFGERYSILTAFHAPVEPSLQ